MSDKRPYSYSVLRYVHDVMTGEFINVGIVLFSPENSKTPAILIGRFRDTIGRIKGAFPTVDRKAFKTTIAAVRRGLTAAEKELKRSDLFANPENVMAFALKIMPYDGSSIQWSPIGTGFGADMTKTLDRLYLRLVSGYDTRSESRRNDDDVWRPVRQAIDDLNIPISLEQKRIIGDVDSVEFQHAWKNGKWHAYEPLSFDYADADTIKNKARRWLGNLTSATSGSLSEPFQAYFIVGRPTNIELLPAYETAIEILKQAPSEPEIFEETQVSELVSHIEDQFRQHVSAQP